MLFNAPLVLLSLLGAAAAGRLDDYARRGGYAAPITHQRMKRAEDCKPEHNSTFRFLNENTKREYASFRSGISK